MVALVVPLLMAGTLSLAGIVEAQQEQGVWFLFKFFPFGFLAFFIYLVAGVAETNRNPFDLPEAESELVAGYFTEYSGMKFIMFWMGEFLEIVTIGGILTTLFFGAWHLPFVSHRMLLSFFDFAGPNGAVVLAMLVNIATFFAKVSFFIGLQMTIRWTLPRFRYDQIMRLCWKMILPLALINIMITGLVILI